MLAPARIARRARQARRRARPRDQQPGGRRARARSTRCSDTDRHDAVVAAPARRAVADGRAVRRPRRAPPRDRAVAVATSIPLAIADREETLIGWLEPTTSTNAWRIAPALAAAGVDVEWCERAAGVLDGATLEPGLSGSRARSPPARCSARSKDSTGRISALVDAVKSYSQLDRASLQVDRRHRGDREHAGDARATSCSDGSPSSATSAPTSRDRGQPRRAQPGVDEPHRQRHRRDGRERHAAHLDGVDGDDLVVEIGDTGAGHAARRRRRRASSRSSRPRTSARAPASASTSRAASSSRHHGQIAIESSEHGTVMRVRLPL